MKRICYTFCDFCGRMNVEEKVTRERRSAFYLRNGAVEAGVSWRSFGVNYDLLWLPIGEPLAEVDVAKDIWALYGIGVSPTLMQMARSFRKAGVMGE